MKNLNFYKYFEDDMNQLHFWETETRINVDEATKVKNEMNERFPHANLSLIDVGSNVCNINIKFYNNADNALFCLTIGKL